MWSIFNYAQKSSINREIVFVCMASIDIYERER